MIFNTRLSPPIPLKTRPNAVAPIKIINTIHVSFVVCCIESTKFFKDNLLCKTASSSAPIAPTAADSVGEAIPKKIDPNTAKIRIRGGDKIVSMFRKLSSFETVLSAGAAAGLHHE